MKILTVCNWGMNRSRHLADYLRGKGYDADFAGINVNSKNRVSQERVLEADVLVFVLPWIFDDFKREFFTDKQRVIVLNVDDAVLLADAKCGGYSNEDWALNAKELLFRCLERQMDEFLPL